VGRSGGPKRESGSALQGEREWRKSYADERARLVGDETGCENCETGTTDDGFCAIIILGAMACSLKECSL
jgi:hypothetical protein